MTNDPPKPEQLVLELPLRQARGAEDFLVSHSNAQAVAIVDAWPQWPGPAVLIVGPEGSGKSHLAHVWQEASQAAIVSAETLGEDAVAALEQAHALVIEDVDRAIASETVAFHLLNLAREKGYAILVTSRRPAGELAITLPDLRSRLRALPVYAIEAPDDGLLKGVLVKLFADRQLAVEPHIINYLALHMSRSMEQAAAVVAAIDRRSLAMQRKVTRAIAAEALAEVAGPPEAE